MLLDELLLPRRLLFLLPPPPLLWLLVDLAGSIGAVVLVLEQLFTETTFFLRLLSESRRVTGVTSAGDVLDWLGLVDAGSGITG